MDTLLKLGGRSRLIIVSVKKQRLYLMVKGVLARTYRVSTALRGVGAEKGSLKTPPGFHRIARKIGAGAPRGTVFKDRVNTREIWDGKSQYGDLILSRIIWLEGLEPGINRGGNVDTQSRYIYLHGTNHRKTIGRPHSHGCVVMRCEDVIDLFDRVRKGDRVLITPV